MAISQEELKTALQTLLSTVKFRLRGRRGTAAQLDPSLMKSGEFAFCTDTRTLYACYVDGVIEQVSHGFIPKATYATLAALQAAHPTGVASDYYMVGTGPYRLYNWGGSAWVDMGVWNDMSLYATAAALTAAVANLSSGWNPAGETWQQNNVSAFTVWADVTGKYQKGDLIRWTQGGTIKYGVIIAVGAFTGGSTVVGIASNTDYVVTNDAITLPCWSRVARPLGFPEWFNWTPAIAGWTQGNGGASGRYKTDGKTCFFKAFITAGSTSSFAAGGINFTYPIASLSGGGNSDRSLMQSLLCDSSTGTVYILAARHIPGISPSNTYQIHLTTNGTALSTTNPVAPAAGDEFQLNGEFEF